MNPRQRTMDIDSVQPFPCQSLKSCLQLNSHCCLKSSLLDVSFWPAELPEIGCSVDQTLYLPIADFKYAKPFLSICVQETM